MLLLNHDWIKASLCFPSLWLPVWQHSPHPATPTTRHGTEGAAADALTATHPPSQSLAESCWSQEHSLNLLPDSSTTPVTISLRTTVIVTAGVPLLQRSTVIVTAGEPLSQSENQSQLQLENHCHSHSWRTIVTENHCHSQLENYCHSYSWRTTVTVGKPLS